MRSNERALGALVRVRVGFSGLFFLIVATSCARIRRVVMLQMRGPNVVKTVVMGVTGIGVAEIAKKVAARSESRFQIYTCLALSLALPRCPESRTGAARSWG
jgi:hypothetical protein